MAYSVIDKSTLHHNTVLYTGDSSYGNGITGVGFQPDLVWIKNRSGTARDHQITDAVRGTDKSLISNSTNGERTGVNLLHSFDSDGFTVDDDNSFNNSGNTFAAWNWKANGAGSANTDGSIDSTASVNATSGFSIVKWTASGSTSTIGHGLGVAPKMIIGKRFDDASSWLTYHASLDATDFIKLHDTAATEDNAVVWGDVEPTSSVFTVGSGFSAGTWVAYCFADVAGYSKVGVYDGNAGGGAHVDNFQYCGFKPKWIISKCKSASESWSMYDAERMGYNQDNRCLRPNTTGGDDSEGSSGIEIYSNGFNPFWGTGTINRSGKSYIWFAIGQPIMSNSGTPAAAI